MISWHSGRSQRLVVVCLRGAKGLAMINLVIREIRFRSLADIAAALPNVR
jgi:hypothetical protein